MLPPTIRSPCARSGGGHRGALGERAAPAAVGRTAADADLAGGRNGDRGRRGSGAAPVARRSGGGSRPATARRRRDGPSAPPRRPRRVRPAADPAPPPVDDNGRKWSDAKGWGGKPPGPGSAVRITDKVVLDTDARIGSLLIDTGGSLVFAKDRSLTLESGGNVEVRGTLALAPDQAHTHTLRFPDIDERRFRGGGTTVVDSDTGLWVTGQGYLRLDGAPRTAWVRAAADLKAGDTTLRLAAAPDGWQPGDELAVTPTARPTPSPSPPPTTW
ncbi:hypothetical protein KCH_17620 [Kitasatospora cheerisanensis KCTC 2395]|uniref:G8 domain-containing protein n=3 Tax=Kitasatospora cheerisanensis TaxID=81942 RepID=A0A066Z8J3_9ACTN|nr:G8 domain-containing protein [Kitasatospora cheerisanensis]KDN86495.1 hypothetical protein KCH_17620 [Kitasatospora cheerisanensis KCTC 2395]